MLIKMAALRMMVQLLTSFLLVQTLADSGDSPNNQGPAIHIETWSESMAPNSCSAQLSPTSWENLGSELVRNCLLPHCFSLPFK